jgi:hypothetical protein
VFVWLVGCFFFFFEEKRKLSTDTESAGNLIFCGPAYRLVQNKFMLLKITQLDVFCYSRLSELKQ